ncbi:antitoxin [Streptomyces sp. PRKS01-65]|nr:antitoxin [Streptomyces harenosi]NEY33475.1 antitoxin [Streptomyces harenosi]
MGLLDSVKAGLGPAKGKVSDLARQHGDRIQHGLDRAARAVDERTRGRYSDRIRAGADKAKGAMDRLAHPDGTGADTGGGTPGTTPPAPDTTPPAGPPPVS